MSKLVGIDQDSAGRGENRPPKKSPKRILGRKKRPARRGHPPVARWQSSEEFAAGVLARIWRGWSSTQNKLVHPGRVFYCQIGELAAVRRAVRTRANALAGAPEPGYPTIYSNKTLSGSGSFTRGDIVSGKEKWDRVAASMIESGWDAGTPALVGICYDTAVLIDSHHRVGIALKIGEVLGDFVPAAVEYLNCRFRDRRAFLLERKRLFGEYRRGERGLS